MASLPARVIAQRATVAANRFLRCLPALLLALLCLRAVELAAGSPVDAPAGQRIDLVLGALAVDAVDLTAGLPLLFLVSLPLLWGHALRWRALAVLWSAAVLAQTALLQYFLTTRVPLGGDLYGYSLPEIRETIAGGLAPNYAVLVALVAALACLWAGLRWARTVPDSGAPWGPAALVIGLAALALAPAPRDYPADEALDARDLKINKLAYFLHDSIAFVATAASPPAEPEPPSPQAATPGVAGATAAALDPRYPFLHEDRTPDVLGPRFERTASGRPPNFVLLLVEGLGRDFSGPGAPQGSFTPQLDQLVGKSLYFENFLAVQGRTFAVLPSLLGSLPFADKGFAKLGARMPPHLSLLSVLKSQGYHLRFYTGTDATFDDERQFLERQGVDVLVDRAGFGPGYAIANAWGYADGELVRRALAGERDAPQPFVTLIQTVTTHTPYTFPGQAAYAARFERRLDELGVPERKRGAYRASQAIYESLLYVDDALARYFDGARQDPAYHDTIFVIMGDHRLPEIAMGEWIDRYRVPLIVFSPLLKAPARIKSVSSQFDVAPSLLAYVSHDYGLRTPRAVTWLGTGLDLEPAFRNVHDLPLKLSKYELLDYISGTSMLSQGRLYRLGDRLDMEPMSDGAELARLQLRFDAFRAANAALVRDGLMPASAPELVAYQDSTRSAVAPLAQPTALSVAELRIPERAAAVEAVFDNAGAGDVQFVPLLVLADRGGRELSESYGAPQTLHAGESATLKLVVKSQGVAPGHYFVSVIPVDAITGKHVGSGRFHVAYELP